MTQAVLVDWRTAPVSRGLRTTLAFLEKLTLAPEDIVPADVAALRAEGLTSRAIVDAVYVCVVFNIINRIADALGFKVPPPRVFTLAAKFLLVFGYQVLSGPQFGDDGDRSLDRRRADRTGDDEALLGKEAVADPYAGKLRRLKEAVLYGPGALDAAVRKAACVAGTVAGAPGAYVKKVVGRAHEVTSEDIAALCRGGYSEDQVFEITVSAALGAGLARLDAALRMVCHQPPLRGFPLSSASAT